MERRQNVTEIRNRLYHVDNNANVGYWLRIMSKKIKEQKNIENDNQNNKTKTRRKDA